MKKVRSPSKLPVRRSAVKVKKEVVPEIETGEMKAITFNMSTLFTIGVFSDIKIAMSEPLDAIDPKEINRVFANKCKECSKICDFSIVFKDKQAKRDKKELLHHFIDGFENREVTRFIMPGNVKKFLEMVMDNICRPFPSTQKITFFDFGDRMEDNAWPHLQLVYKATFRLFDSNLGVKIENLNFLSTLVSNSCSPDGRERQACRDILKSLCIKCPDMHRHIIRFVMNQFQLKICSKELLDFFIVLIDSMHKPLSPKDIFMYKQCVLVLHSSHLFPRFCLNLLEVINHYIKVDQNLLEPTFEYIFTHWPCSNTRKQLIFWSEIEGLVVSYSALISPTIAAMIFNHLAKYVNSPHSESANTVINLILGVSLERTIIENMSLAMKILVAPLVKAAKHNWNEYVRENAHYALVMFQEIDQEIFAQIAKNIPLQDKQKKAYKEIGKTRWTKVFESAQMNDKSIKGINMNIML